MSKRSLNANLKISDGNLTLKEGCDHVFLIFNLVARTTCPYATEECKRICHERFPQEINPRVMTARIKNLEESKKIALWEI